ncbi:MAG: quinolinate synthase NadA [Methanomicrobiales archaeon]|nr:quinolinate synthase NadA [Methanomicrobiales archaeon]
MQAKRIAGRKGHGDLAGRIRALKEERDAVILAHNYQVPEVQDLADLVGDSLELARAAATRDEAVIIFCGVDFMAETAAILSPEKTVLLPAGDACCPMAQMVTAGEVEVLRERYPGAAVVCYVNTTAEVKAASDICCTSANAVRVVRSLEEDRVIFVPDRNLALYTARFTEKEIIPWEGFCIVHDRITPEEVRKAKDRYPGAEVIVHPECRPGVIDLADQVSSTSGMVRHVCESPKETFVIGTEVGILYRMRKLCPGKRCVPLSPKAICANMKKTTPTMVIRALETMGPRITVPEETARGARAAIERMLSLQ